MKQLVSPRAAIAIACLVSAVAIGCTRDSAGPAGSEDGVVVVRLTAARTFVPAEIEIEPGTTVRWVNESNTFHTVTPDGHAEWNRFPTSVQGDRFEHTFDSIGDFPYFCEPHRSVGMVGSITVR